MEEIKKELDSGNLNGQENQMRPESLASVIKDPMALLQEKAEQTLQKLKIINAADIIAAFKDKDSFGHMTTSIEFMKEYWSPLTEEVTRRQSKLVTLSPEIRLECAGGYTTVVLHFDGQVHQDMNRIWNILTTYANESNKVDSASLEIPVLIMTAVPMSLGGIYGMVATDPIFWAIQPSTPLDKNYNQIRILYQPEAVVFLKDNSFRSEEIIKKVKSELAAERLTEEDRLRKEQENEEFKRQHEAEMSTYLATSKNKRHSFVVNQK